jgi:hypothetical protein
VDEQGAVSQALQIDVAVDSELGLVSAVIRERERLLGTTYPFEFDGNALRYRGSRRLVYEFCLSIGRVETVSENPYRQLQIAFERLSAGLLCVFLGPGTVGLRTGHPADGSDPGQIRRAVELLNGSAPDEWEWNPTVGDEDIARAKDGGVDAAVWKSPDDRPGSIIFVCNAACGRHWLESGKYSQRPSRMVRDFVRRPYEEHLLDVFAMPFHIAHHLDWWDTRKGAGFVLDRLRLTRIADGADDADWARVTSVVGEVDLGELIAIVDDRLAPQVLRET